jgi:O-antigen ligase
MARPRQLVAPLYLFACLLLGGSVQGIWSNMLLQVAGVLIIAWAAAVGPIEPLSRPARQLLWIAAAGLAVIALQLIPLPAPLWAHLGGRAAIGDGYHVLGIGIPALPVSLAPFESVATLMTAIPALAVLCALLVLKAYRPLWLALALIAGAFAGIILGALQVASAGAARWYLYRESSFGFASGFFANSNHMASLLVIAVPFLAAMLASVRRTNADRYSAAVALAGGAFLVILVGIALSRSIAGYGLIVPAVLLSFLILRPSKGVSRFAVPGAGVLLLGAVAIMAWSPAGETRLGTGAAVSSRATILAVTGEAVRDFMPWGSGLGTFRPVYKLYENHDLVTREVVNHAHNEYVELALETGIPGVLVMLAFLLWWARTSWRAWRSPDSSPYAKAASIASAVILAHSLVDFPARTATIGSCLTMCLALLLERRARPASERADLRPTRHLALD